MSFLITAVVGGTVLYSFGVFFDPMASDLGWPRGVTATAFSMMILVMGASAPIVAAAITRFGVRKVLVIGTSLLIIATLLMSVITQVWQLYIVYGLLVGMSMAAGSFLTLTILINYWFIKHKGLAIGIVQAGPGIGAIILAPFTSYLIGRIDWRSSWLVLGAIVFIFACLPAIILVRGKPEDIGQFPYGSTIDRSTVESSSAQEIQSTTRDWGVKEALRTPTLWLITVFMCANMFVLNMVTVHQVVYLTDIGVSEIMAASALGLMAGISGIARIIGGILADRIQPRFVAAIACLLETVALIILINARVLPLIYVYIIVFGMAYGWLIVSVPTIIGNYYGRKNYGAIYSRMFLLSTFMSAAGPVFAGFFFDSTGSYLIPFSVAASFCVVGAVSAFFARRPKFPSNAS